MKCYSSETSLWHSAKWSWQISQVETDLDTITRPWCFDDAIHAWRDPTRVCRCLLRPWDRSRPTPCLVSNQTIVEDRRLRVCLGEVGSHDVSCYRTAVATQRNNNDTVELYLLRRPCLWSRKLRSTVLKAALRSSGTRMVTCCEFIFNRISS